MFRHFIDIMDFPKQIDDGLKKQLAYYNFVIRAISTEPLENNPMTRGWSNENLLIGSQSSVIAVSS